MPRSNKARGASALSAEITRVTPPLDACAAVTDSRADGRDQRVTAAPAATPELPFVVCVGTDMTESVAIARLVRRGVVLVAADTASAQALLQGAERPVAHPATPATGPATVPTRVGHLRIDRRTREVRWRDRVIELSAREFDLVAALSSEANRVWTFEELTSEVWRTPYLGDRDAVLSAVKRLRRRLTAAGAEVVIGSVRAVGFRLVVTADSPTLRTAGPDPALSW